MRTSAAGGRLANDHLAVSMTLQQGVLWQDRGAGE